MFQAELELADLLAETTAVSDNSQPNTSLFFNDALLHGAALDAKDDADPDTEEDPPAEDDTDPDEAADTEPVADDTPEEPADEPEADDPPTDTGGDADLGDEGGDDAVPGDDEETDAEGEDGEADDTAESDTESNTLIELSSITLNSPIGTDSFADPKRFVINAIEEMRAFYSILESLDRILSKSSGTADDEISSIFGAIDFYQRAISNYIEDMSNNTAEATSEETQKKLVDFLTLLAKRISSLVTAATEWVKRRKQQRRSRTNKNTNRSRTSQNSGDVNVLGAIMS